MQYAVTPQERSQLAQALIAQSMQPVARPNLTSAASTLANAIMAKKQMERAQLEQDQLNQQRQADLASALSAYRGDQPFQADTFPGENPAQLSGQDTSGLKTKGSQQNYGALAESLVGAQDPMLQQIGLKQLMAQPQQSEWKMGEIGVKDGMRQKVMYNPLNPSEFVAMGEPYQQKAMVENTINTGGPTTPGLEAADKEFAKEYVAWKGAGGFANVQKNLDQVMGAREKLKSGEVETGFIAGITPDFLKAATDPELLAVKQNVEQVVQESLKAILGAQFTEKEGEKLIQRAFDDKLKPEENIARLNRLVTQISTAAQAKQEAAEYFEENGTLQGFKGKVYSTADFSPDRVFGKDDKKAEQQTGPATPKTDEEYNALPSGALFVDPDDGKTYRKP